MTMLKILISLLIILFLSACHQSGSDALGIGYIYNGTPVSQGDWPAVAALTDKKGKSFCSAVFISKSMLITAAHCVSDPVAQYIDNTLVYLGNGADFEYGYYKIKTARKHPKATQDENAQNWYDVAYIILEKELDFVVPILPPQNTMEVNEVYRPGSEVTIIGFGLTEQNVSGIKNIAHTNLQSATDHEFIAGGNGQDTCFGDSGGPVLAQLSDQTYRVIGITSRSLKYMAPCGTFTTYSKITMAQSWIFIEEAAYFMEKNEYQRAIELYTNGIDIDPNNPDLYLNRAVSYYALDDEQYQGDLIQAVQLITEESVVSYLLKKSNNAALDLVAQIKDPILLELLITNGRDIDAQDAAGWSLLTLALKKKYPDIGQLLIDMGANINIKAKDGSTILMAACSAGDVELVRFLLDNGADINAKDKRQKFPLLIAAMANYPQIVTLLLDYGADINTKDRFGTTTLENARIMGLTQIVAILEQYRSSR